MENMPYRALSLIVSITGLAALALLSHPKRAHAEEAQAHCAKVGNDDTVRTIPPSLIAGAASLFDEPPNEAAADREMYVYRCMGGSVWVCNHGANIPCAKGNTRRVLPSVTIYCKENPNEDFVPMVITGHDTIHSWACVGGKACRSKTETICDVVFSSPRCLRPGRYRGRRLSKRGDSVTSYSSVPHRVSAASVSQV
jgi:hypothetical protein